MYVSISSLVCLKRAGDSMCDKLLASIPTLLVNVIDRVEYGIIDTDGWSREDHRIKKYVYKWVVNYAE